MFCVLLFLLLRAPLGLRCLGAVFVPTQRTRWDCKLTNANCRHHYRIERYGAWTDAGTDLAARRRLLGQKNAS